VASLGSAAEFVGPEACGGCHPKQYQSQRATNHARALRPVNETALSALLANQSIRDRSGAVFQYRQAAAGVEVSITKGAASARMLLEWCFGAGSKGLTPVGRSGGEYIEHRVSWYRQSGRLGLTAGHPAGAPAEITAFLGVPQPPATISRCFGCHATAVESGPDLSRMLPGVTCERCHGPGGGHVAAARGGKSIGNTVFNPRRVSAAAQVQVCAQCHRSPNAEFPSSMPELDDAGSIRFAPVGFQVSVCFLKSKALSCVTCHDPHANPRPASDPAYTTVCLQCHSDSPRPPSSCRRASQAGCVGCHMKKAAPMPDLTFTDHRIRIYVE
jgi:predicted CXXCH cytochrome family protein